MSKLVLPDGSLSHFSGAMPASLQVTSSHGIDLLAQAAA
jgi:hypothetical protein